MAVSSLQANLATAMVYLLICRFCMHAAAALRFAAAHTCVRKCVHPSSEVHPTYSNLHAAVHGVVACYPCRTFLVSVPARACAWAE
jgi:hypothetical protein